MLSDAEKRKQYDQMRRLGAFEGARGARVVARGRPARRAMSEPRVSISETSAAWATSSPPSSAAAGARRSREASRSRRWWRCRSAWRRLGGKITVTIPVTESVPHLQRHRRRAWRDLVHLPGVQRPRNHLVRAGRVRGQPAVSPVPRTRQDPVAACPDLPGRGRRPDREAGRDHRAAGHRERLAHPAPGSGRDQPAGRHARAISSSPSRCSPTGSFTGRDSTSSARCRSTSRRRRSAPGSGCGRSTARRSCCGFRRAPSRGASSGSRGRDWRRTAGGATSLWGCRSPLPGELTAEQQDLMKKFAESAGMSY